MIIKDSLLPSFAASAPRMPAAVAVTTVATVVVMVAAGGAAAVHGEVLKQAMEDGVDVSITYPGSVMSGAGFEVTILVENRGWEDKHDVRFGFKPGAAITPRQEELVIGRISEGGSRGETVGFDAFSAEGGGLYFMNVEYAHVLGRGGGGGGEDEPFRTDVAIPITVKDGPEVRIHTTAPESVFADAEFPFVVEVVSDDIDLRDLRVMIVPPGDVGFRGETLHTYSNVKRGEVVSVRSEVITLEEDVGSQHTLPFEVVVMYVDHRGEEKTESVTVPLVLRPRTFMEITTDGGVWIGGFFIAPYISIGTIVGIPAGAILSVLIKRAQDRRRGKGG